MTWKYNADLQRINTNLFLLFLLEDSQIPGDADYEFRSFIDKEASTGSQA